MVGEINFSALDTNAPARIAESFNFLGAYQKGLDQAQEKEDKGVARQSTLQAQQLNALNLRKATDEMDRGEKLRNVLASHDGDIMKALPEINALDPVMGNKLAGELMGQQKDQQQLDTGKLEQYAKKADIVGQAFLGLQGKATPQGIMGVLQGLEAQGIDTKAMRQNPNFVNARTPEEAVEVAINGSKEASKRVAEALAEQQKQQNWQATFDQNAQQHSATLAETRRGMI